MVLDLDKSGRIPQTGKTYLGPTEGWKYTDEPTNIEYVIGGSGEAIPGGYKGGLLIPDWLHINNVALFASAVGSVVIDVYKITKEEYLAGTVPSAADSIVGAGTKPSLVAAVSSNLTLDQLTGWNTRIDQNDFVAFNIDSIGGLSLLTIVLQCVRDIGPS